MKKSKKDNIKQIMTIRNCFLNRNRSKLGGKICLMKITKFWISQHIFLDKGEMLREVSSMLSKVCCKQYLYVDNLIDGILII